MGKDPLKITTLPLLQGLSDQTTTTLLANGRRSSLTRKGSILSGDDLSQRLYVLLDGRMKMLRPSTGGEESLQQRLMPGDIFCPAAMVSGEGCGSYAESLGPCQLLSWPHRQFHRLMEQDERLRTNLLMLLARHVEEERNKRCLSQCVNVRARVAAFLLARINQNDNTPPEIDLRPMSLTAQELGMARGTMSRAFSTFERDGILYRHRGLIQVRDYSRLQMIADGSNGCCCQHVAL